MPEYYHNLITEQSWELLQQLRRQFKFVLIGGWAVFLWTKNLKSKDIDLAVDTGELKILKDRYDLVKNDRLRKYEIKQGVVDIDVYVSYYSNPGIPAEDLPAYAENKEGFMVPKAEVLTFLKLNAYSGRQGTPKGDKDRLDILGLLALPEFDFIFFKSLPFVNHQALQKIEDLVKSGRQALELGWNEFHYSRIKKSILKKLQ